MKNVGFKYVVLLFALLSGIQVSATNYYVSTRGSNNNNGIRRSPWQTINYALMTWPSIAPHTYNAGDTLFIEGGLYPEGIVVSNIVTCHFNNLVISAASMVDKPILQPPTINAHTITLFGDRGPIHNITFRGLIIDGSNNHCKFPADGIKLSDSDVYSITFSDCEIRNCDGQGCQAVEKSHNNAWRRLHVHDNGGNSTLNHGFYLISNNDTVEDCLVDHNSGDGIRTGTTHPEHDANNILIRNNITCFNGIRSFAPRGGIAVSNCDSGVVVYNNISYCNMEGIILDVHADNVRIYNNTVYNNYKDGFRAGSFPTDKSVKISPCLYDTVENNIFYRNGDMLSANGDRVAYTIDSPDIIYISNNSENTVDPLFYDAAAGNFKLQRNSPDIGKGLHFKIVKTDFEWNSRPEGNRCNLGALEGDTISGPVRKTFYVDSANGNDIYPGTASRPYQSFIRGMAELLPGDTLIAGNGSYIENYYSFIPYGLPDAPIVLKAKAGCKPVLRSSRLLTNFVFPTASHYRGGSITHDLIIDGITFDAQDYTGAKVGSALQVYGRNIVFNNCSFINPNRFYIDVMSAARGVQFTNCVFDKSNTASFGTVRVLADSAIFKNCTWNGNDSGNDVYVAGRFGIYDGCNVANAAGHGIYLTDKYQNISAGYNVISNCNIHDNDSSGIYLGGQNHSIQKNKIYNNNAAGIYAYNVRNTEIANNTVYGNGNQGIFLNKSAALYLHDNNIYKNKSNGIEVNETDAVKVHNNTINDNANSSIVIYSNSHNPDVSNNKVYSNRIDQPVQGAPVPLNLQIK